LEKGSSFTRSSLLLPPYDSRATLAALEAVLARREVEHIISLGDSFHDAEAAARLFPAEVATICRLTARCFATDGHRAILPSFGAYTGGLDVLDTAVAGLSRRAFTVHILGREKIHVMPRRKLVPWGEVRSRSKF
jgi:metallophosphoesterase superfamily enzyme